MRSNTAPWGGRASRKEKPSNWRGHPSIPRLVQFTSRSAPRHSRSRVSGSKGAGVRRGCRAHSSPARFRVRLQTRTRSAPAWAKARATALAAPPAPSRVTVLPAGSKPSTSPRADKAPAPSVLKPTHAPSRRQTVFTAPVRRAAGSMPSSRGSRSSLWGMVALKPATPWSRAQRR